MQRGPTPWLALGLNGEVTAIALLAAGRPRLAWPAAGLWLLLMIYELARLVGVYLMNQDPLIYDQLQLLSHFMILLTDLWGARGTLAVIAIFSGLLLSLTIAARLLRRGLVTPGLRRIALAGVIASAAGAAASDGPWPARWSAASLLPNLRQSLSVWRSVQRGISGAPYAAAMDLHLERTPDVSFYILESYGRMIYGDEVSRVRMGLLCDELGTKLEARGWSLAAGFSRSPVSGGRSWLADGTALSGLRVAHESVWQQLTRHLDTLPHLPRFMAQQGYTTVVVRPKDRERQGLVIRNDFGWDVGIFHDELGYRGPHIGWGWIPDQYSLGRLRDELLPGLPHPRFLWFHGVVGHGPWEEVPPLVTDWRTLDQLDGYEDFPEFVREDSHELKFRLQRYRRIPEDHRRTRGSLDALREGYLAAVRYALTAATEAAGAAADSPPDGQLIVLMGDHQPPILSRFDGHDVPVHVLASDPELLQPFLDRGFVPGFRPRGREHQLTHEGLFAHIVRTLARADGQVPPELPDGVDITDYVPPKPVK